MLSFHAFWKRRALKRPSSFNPEPPLGLKTVTSIAAEDDIVSSKLSIVTRTTRLLLTLTMYVSVRRRRRSKAKPPDEIDDPNACWGVYGWRKQPRRFPRPLSSTMNGGRLVIKEHKLYHYEYIRTTREDNRLKLQLVSLHKKSLLLPAPPKPERQKKNKKEKEMSVVVHSKEDSQTKLSRSSSSSSLSCSLKIKESSTKEIKVVKSTDSNAQPQEIRSYKGKDQKVEESPSTKAKTQPQAILSSEGKEKIEESPSEELWFARSYLMALSSSMPEPIVPDKVGKGCFEHQESLHPMPAVTRMRPVES